MFQKEEDEGVRKQSRGRPRLALEDNETRERILNTAQRLFAQKGFDKVNLRELTKEANTHLAAVNYYFGTKDQLLVALVKRASDTIGAERDQLLQEALSQDLSVRARVEVILKALLRPSVAAVDGNCSVANGTLLARASDLELGEELLEALREHNAQLQLFVDALANTLPNADRSDVSWQLYFLLNIEKAVHTQLERIEHFGEDISPEVDEEALLDRIIAFAVPGLLSLADSAGVH